eukprot:scaffold19245_cov199-Amphora_coffeaeformis.AAC.10
MQKRSRVQQKHLVGRKKSCLTHSYDSLAPRRRAVTPGATSMVGGASGMDGGRLRVAAVAPSETLAEPTLLAPYRLPPRTERRVACSSPRTLQLLDKGRSRKGRRRFSSNERRLLALQTLAALPPAAAAAAAAAAARRALCAFEAKYRSTELGPSLLLFVPRLDVVGGRRLLLILLLILLLPLEVECPE